MISYISILWMLVSILALFVTKNTTTPNLHSNTTVVILNWSRFSNVRKITSVICESLLDDVVYSIIVWNNNPNPITFADFTNTTCPESRLVIINSAVNIYFQARYMACTRAKTLFCFIQDDDYLVEPNTIRALSARVHDGSAHSVHLQPPDEMLSSQLRKISIPPSIETTFAWLGYGTMIKRASASAFLSLLKNLQLSKEEQEMADNYFTILSNHIPERWFDPGIPLGGGMAFTVGTAGEERNNHHIRRAAELLDSITQTKDRNLPYIQFSPRNAGEVVDVSRAPCHRDLCIFQTSIKLLPDFIDISVVAANDILDVEKRRLVELGENKKAHYLDFPPSNAVDGRYETVFRSSTYAKVNEWVLLDLVVTASPGNLVLVLVVERETEIILQNTLIQVSQDGKNWDLWNTVLLCTEFAPHGTGNNELQEGRLRMCKTGIFPVAVRFIRLSLLKDMEYPWAISEIHVEHLNKKTNSNRGKDGVPQPPQNLKKTVALD